MKFEDDDWRRYGSLSAAGEDHNAPAKKSKIGDGGEQDPPTEHLDLIMKTDSEISMNLARIKKNLKLIGEKLPDRGDKMKAKLRRYEDELQRRIKLQSDKKYSSFSSPDHAAEDKPSNGVEAQMNGAVDLDLVMKTESEIGKHTKNLQTLADKLPDKAELERKTKLQSNKKDSTSSSPDGLAGNKPSESHSGVATNALTVNTANIDALTDEKMQKIVNELVNVGISETDVGKAAEICYNDPVKVKVLFALPSHLRKFYVEGFLRN